MRELKARQQAIETLKTRGALVAITALLKEVGDLERVLTRVALRSARPRDLAQLRDGLDTLPALTKLFAQLDAARLRSLTASCGVHEAERALLQAAIVATPPVLLRDGGVIATGYDAELDELRAIASNANQYSSDLETRERERTRIPNLRVGYNRVHGYYIEITNSHAASVPADYIRRQTLKGAERYITEELKGFEDKVLSANERALAREKLLYDGVLEKLCGSLTALQQTAACIAELDALTNLAERVDALGLAKPDLVDEARLEYRAGRHLGVHWAAPHRSCRTTFCSTTGNGC